LEYITKHKRADWKIYHSTDFKLDGGSEFPEWFKKLILIGSRQKNEDSDVLRSALEAVRNEGLDSVKEKNKPTATEKDATQSETNAESEEETA
jgi:hypothetical protein